MTAGQANVDDDRYARQRLLSGWRQERLSEATVLVAGAGALGNEVLKNLVLLGVGHLLIVDLDTVERSNLSRTVLFSEADVGAPKASAAANALVRLNPSVGATPFNGDLRFVLGLGQVHRCSLVIGCLDNNGARSFLNRLCTLAQVPLLDGAMWSMGGEVRAFLEPSGPCFDCMLSPEERTHLWLRYSCSGFRTTPALDFVPTIVTTAAIIGGLLAQQAARLLCGQPLASGDVLVYNGQAGRMHRSTLTRDRECPNHAPIDWAQVIPLPQSPPTITAQEVLALAGPSSTLDLGRDLLIAFDCPGCGLHEPIGQLQAQLDEAAIVCPRCGRRRIAQVTSTVTLADHWSEWSLARLGIPGQEVLSVRSGDTVVSYQVS
jgi:molybdopterin/thiamine biosynthesis adenylyltransferase